MATKKLPKIVKKSSKTTRTGRPKKEYLDYFTVQKIIEMLMYDCTVEQSCAYAGISTSTHYSWIENKKTYMDKTPDGTIVERPYEDTIASAKEYAGIIASKTIFKAIEGGDAKIAMEYKKRRDIRYRDKQEVTGKDGETLQTVIFYIPDNDRNNDYTATENNTTTKMISGEST